MKSWFKEDMEVLPTIFSHFLDEFCAHVLTTAACVCLSITCLNILCHYTWLQISVCTVEVQDKSAAATVKAASAVSLTREEEAFTSDVAP